MGEKNRIRIKPVPLLLALPAASGAGFLYFSLAAGQDDIFSLREAGIAGALCLFLFAASYLISRSISAKILIPVFCCAVLGALAVNFEYPELMKGPLQLPAENRVTVLSREGDASLSVTWAYRFRPPDLEGDVFLTDPDRDISFSQLKRIGRWEESFRGEDAVLTTAEDGASIGIAEKFRTHLAVLCLRAEGGEVQVRISGQQEVVTLTPQMTDGQPYRVLLANGVLKGAAGNAVQVFFWGCAFYFVILCGTALCLKAGTCLQERKTFLICVYAFLIPVLILLVLCVFLKITPFGEKTFLINDMWGEYAEYMAYFRSVLSGENDLFYSFSKSLGDDLLSLLAFYVINPLNWLVCLFPAEKMPQAVTLLVILRYGICGTSAALYFVKGRKCGHSALIFSTCYALMSFAIVNAENTNLREGMLMLPLVLLGLERIIEGGSPRVYIWALAGTVFLNYYSAYQICIFSLLYFLYYYFREDRKGPFLRRLYAFAAASLTAVGISAFLLLPVVLQLRNGPKSVSASDFGLLINMPWRGLAGKLFASAYDTGQIADGFPSLYTGMLCLLLLPVYFLNREIPARKKLAGAGLLLVCVMIMQLNPLNLALHGFTAPLWWPYRYSFIVSFFLIMTAQECFACAGGIRKTALLLSMLLLLVTVFILGAADLTWLTADSLRMNVCLLAALLCVFLSGISGDVRAPAVLGILTVLDLFLNASHILSINTEHERSCTVSDYAAYYRENRSLFDRLEEADGGFYRVEKSYSKTSNEPMVFDYAGLTHYSSTLNSSVMDFLRKTGFRLQEPYRINYWDGSDIAMDSLLGIRYLVAGKVPPKPYGPVLSSEEHTVYENPYALPLMFTASPAALEADTGREPEGFALQNAVFSALTGRDTRIFIPLSAEMTSAAEPEPRSGSGDVCYSAAEGGNADLSWQFRTKSADTLYVFFPASELHQASLTLNGSPSGEYFDAGSFHIQKLGSLPPDTEAVLEMTSYDETLCLRDAQFFHEDQSALTEAVRTLKEDPAELHKLGSSRLEGTFSASGEKILFFSIPYDPGWTVRIDGQKVTAEKVFGTFMAVRVPAGTHTVSLRFIPAGFIAGTIITVVSAAAALFIGKNKKRQTSEERG